MRKVKNWNRVKAPKAWHPEVGEEITGTYLGSRLRNGSYGDYIVHFIRQHNNHVYFVSGSILNDLFALLGEGEEVKLIFTGMKTSKTSGNEYKTFELYSENAAEFKLELAG